MITEIVVLGRDNTVDLLLKTDGDAQPLDAVTRMVLIVGGVTVDSAVVPAAFDWHTGTTGKLVLDLGGVSSLTTGLKTATLYVYDPSNTDGIRWGSIKLNIENN